MQNEIDTRIYNDETCTEMITQLQIACNESCIKTFIGKLHVQVDAYTSEVLSPLSYNIYTCTCNSAIRKFKIQDSTIITVLLEAMMVYSAINGTAL